MKRKTRILTILFLMVILMFNSSCSFIKHSEDITKSTVFILALKLEPPKEGIITIHRSEGTGFIIDKEGYILTASHVLDGYEDRIYVFFVDYDGTSTHEYIGKREGIDFGEGVDLAILKIDPDPDHSLKEVKIYQGDIKIGYEVGFMGFPATAQEENPGEFWEKQLLPFVEKGLKPGRIIRFLNEGIISAKFWEIKKKGTIKYYFLNTFSSGGDSGGPVFLKSNGKVVGVLKGGKRIKIGVMEDGNITKVVNETLPFGVVFVTPVNNIPNLLKEWKSIRPMSEPITYTPSWMDSSSSFYKTNNLSLDVNSELSNLNLYTKICIGNICI